MLDPYTITLPEWNKLICNSDPTLFLSKFGNGLKFTIQVRDFNIRNNLITVIHKCGGLPNDRYEEIKPESILIIDNYTSKVPDWETAFHYNFVIDCIKQSQLVDLQKYKVIGSNHQADIMKELVEENFVFKRNLPCIPSVVKEASIEDKMNKFVNKHSKTLYSRNEKEAILQYIIIKRAYNRLKSDALYKEMEEDNICPKRTYQSMKNHFLKKIIFELDGFDFMTESIKEKILKN